MLGSDMPAQDPREQPDTGARATGASPLRSVGLIAQVVAVELAAVAALLAWPAGTVGRVALGAVALLVLLAALGRFRGRAVAVWAVVLARFWRRRRGGPARPAQVPRVDSFYDRAGTAFGLIHDARGLTAVLALEPVRPDLVDRPDAEMTFALGPLLAFAERGDVRLAELRLVSHEVAAPSGRFDRRTRPSASYREVAGEHPAGQRSVWVCLRVDPALCPEAVAARGGGVDGARRALAAVAARLVAAVDPPLRLRPLSSEEVRSLAMSLPELDGGTTERVDAVTGGEHVAVAHVVERWGGVDLPALVRELTGAGVIGVRTALEARPQPRAGWAVRSLVVLQARSAEWERVAREVERRTAALGAVLRRLDGEHRPALVAALPVAGPGWPELASRDGARSILAGVTGPLQVEASRGGLLLGEAAGSPAQLSLFRERPTSIVTAMDPRVVAVLCFRAVALGAQVIVLSDRSEPWESLRRFAVDQPDGVRLLARDAAPAGVDPASADRPTLVLVDQGPPAPRPMVTPAPWQCVVHVLPDASLRSFSAGADAGVVLLQCLDPSETVGLAPLLGVTPEAAATLARLSDDELGIVEQGRVRDLRWTLSGVEAQLVAEATARSARSPAGAAQA